MPNKLKEVTKEQVLKAARTCRDADGVLRILYPDAFTKECLGWFYRFKEECRTPFSVELSANLPIVRLVGVHPAVFRSASWNLNDTTDFFLAAAKVACFFADTPGVTLDDLLSKLKEYLGEDYTTRFMGDQ